MRERLERLTRRLGTSPTGNDASPSQLDSPDRTLVQQLLCVALCARAECWVAGHSDGSDDTAEAGDTEVATRGVTSVALKGRGGV